MRRHLTIRRRIGAAGAVCAIAAVTSLAFTSAGSAKATKQIVMFAYSPAGDNYIAQYESGIRAEAKKLGVSIKLIINPVDQVTENNQVLQQLAVGTKPAAYIWQPVDQNAGLASLQKLAATGVPVIQANQAPIAQDLQFIKFYTGTNFTDNGVTSASAIVAARNALRASGAKLHSPTGNLVLDAWPQAFSVTAQKLAGVQTGLKKRMNLIDTEYAPTPQSAGGFTGMNTAISKVGSQGIDVVYGFNDGLADGAIQALQQAGYRPGKNVMVVGGNCFGDFTPLIDGTQYSTMIVAGQLEGEYLVKTVQQYLTNGGKVKSGTFTAPATPNKFPNLPSAPFKQNFLPQPALIVDKGSPAANQKLLNKAKLWGVPVTQLCGVPK